MKRAVVVKSTGSWYTIKNEEDEVFEARILGKFRLNGLSLTNPVAVGDRVKYEMEDTEENTAIIREIEPRQNYIVRQSPRKRHHLHLLASNIDQAILVMTIVQPKLKQGVIDRFLLMTEPHDIPVTIAFNKADVYSEEDLHIFEILKSIYTDIGYEVALISAVSDRGLDELKSQLRSKTTLISGQSGVGKSTLINALVSDLDIKTSELSDYSGKGQHTTTFAQMYDMGYGSIIDTPGFKSLSFNNLEPMDVAHNFREFFAKSPECKYPDCTHRDEPKCAIKNAIEEGSISELRYLNYLQILDEIEDQNYWERHKHM